MISAVKRVHVHVLMGIYMYLYVFIHKITYSLSQVTNSVTFFFNFNRNTHTCQYVLTQNVQLSTSILSRLGECCRTDCISLHYKQLDSFIRKKH